MAVGAATVVILVGLNRLERAFVPLQRGVHAQLQEETPPPPPDVTRK